MNTQQKTLIANELSRLAQKTSQNHMAKLLEVSTALVSQVINNNWKLISNEMWRIIEAKLFIDTNWNTVETTNFKILSSLLKSSQDLGISIGISDTPGKSKSETYKHFWKAHIGQNIYVQCKNSWTKKSYLKNLLVASGQESYGKTEELLERFINHLRSIDAPSLTLDQFDKLKDPQLDLFMDLYNDLNGKCGFVVSGVKALEKRILKGVQRDKIGYAEFYSRIGKKFIKLDHITYNDVALICKANGVQDNDEILFIYENCEDDLRRVRRDIDKYKLKQNLKQTA
ncbi:AAA family ATPase [Yeosuana marina]|uniref:AAA family ATPase n=1 Tax=Yeosuana marina TaxID=1565536 RepID=UPI001422B1D1|nr:AAA family ATPase [Yeosuana marina]